MAFSQAAIEAAFPEFSIDFPHLGIGSFKEAYSIDNNGVRCVLKVLMEPIVSDSEEFDPADLPDRIARELEGMRSINSPHVVSMIGEPQLREVEGLPRLWYLEPFFDGGTLKDRLIRGPLSEREVIVLAIGLLNAVETMWSHDQIVHRDIKPGNIVYDVQNQPVLLDLGIALYSNMTDLTDSGVSSPRTRAYSAPEQWDIRRNRVLDFRTDLFQIGIVLFEALVGRHPFYSQGMNEGQLLTALESFDARTLDSANCDPILKNLISRLLDAQPSRRYRSPRIPLEILEFAR
jgi:serine/threonine protein kinase